jgi:hypothetical protein
MTPLVRADVWHAGCALATGLLLFLGLAIGAGGVETESDVLLRLAPVSFAVAAASDAVRTTVVARILGTPPNVGRVVMGVVLALVCAGWAILPLGFSRTVFRPVLSLFSLFY